MTMTPLRTTDNGDKMLEIGEKARFLTEPW